MSWVCSFEIACDAEDCTVVSDGGFSKREAREIAKRAGFIRCCERDFCWTCAPEHKKKKIKEKKS